MINAGAVVTGPPTGEPVRHPTHDHLGVRTGVGVGVEEGRIAIIAPDEQVRDWLREAARRRDPEPDGGRTARRAPAVGLGTPPDSPAEALVDCEGRLVTPGLVDCHTHAVFGKPRVEDQARRARGEDYKGIAAAGGGILSSVEDFRARGEDELLDLTRTRVRLLAGLGTTAVEIKSGYGLTLDEELKALRVARRLAAELPLTVVPTFLGAHEVPTEYRLKRDGYIRLVTEQMLPAVVRAGLASFCDVFCEPGVFSIAESEAILTAATALGLGAKLHADELDPAGAAELAARLGAVSADHLGAIHSAGIDALAASGTVAVLLPGTLVFLGKTRQAPARSLVDSGAIVALATDFNPGSSPSANLPLMMALGVSQARLQPEEVFLGATVNAAWALRLADGQGRLTVGGRADIAVWNCRDVGELSYWYGMPLAWRVYAAGRPCHGGEAGISSAGYRAGPLSPPLS
ncbi:MAG: imidazolonepropionase [Gemmatimonadetes bacterium]|nr:imidazolonepropionase [Gemmatimonadota bacterium]